MNPDAMTHAALIDASACWLRKKGCSVVITDMTHGGRETPDAIGFHGTRSLLIECKVSRSDFAADAQKHHRRFPDQGMGVKRWYATPQGLIMSQEVPAGWGLLVWNGRKLIEAKKASRLHPANRQMEISILLSALRRVAHTCPKGLSVRLYAIETKCRATLGVQPLAELREAGETVQL